MSQTVPGPDRGDLKSATYEFFMLAMAVLSIANLPLLYRLKTASSKSGYFVQEEGFFDL